ncbi:hypothetical protein EDD22DRAFT_775043, partial [Suillus occidentalis]
ETSHFFTPESLHHIHKQFYDHDAQWIIIVVGESELDFWFSVLQPTTGYQHFHRGISKLKQVTSCTHALPLSHAMPPGIMTSIHALMHFRYLMQSPCIDDDNLICISAALEKFHVNKHTIITAGVHQRKDNMAINNWYIPKLELMQNIVPSIHSSGVIGQWSADATEHAHIMEVKHPTRSTNNNNCDLQICRYLDHTNKCDRFDLAIGLLDGKLSIEGLEVVREEHKDDDIDENADVEIIPMEIPSRTQQSDQLHPIMNYFMIVKILQHKKVGSIPIPLCSFIVGRTALHFAYDPSIRNISIDEVAIIFNLPDLCPAVADFLHCEVTSGYCVHTISGPQRAGSEAELPFNKLQV